MESVSVKEMFPDWDRIPPGEWSSVYFKLEYLPNRFFEFGLYREPIDSGEYAGTYTLQAFDGDSVIFCETVF